MAEKSACCSVRLVFELLLIFLASIAYAVKVGVCVYGWWGDPSTIALELSLPSAFLEYSLPISPPLWTQALWLLIFSWEALALLLAWAILFRPRTPQLVFPVFYLFFTLVCLLHIGWVFAWGRKLLPVSLTLVAIQTVVLVVCMAILTTYLYYIRGSLKFYYSCNFWSTRLLVLNCTVAHATFSFILTLFNLAALLVSAANLAEETASTILLSILASCVITYFLLENTILDRFLRYVFASYPVVLWTLIGVLVGVWQGEESLTERNHLFVLVLTCVVGALLLLRVLLWCVFGCARPLPDYERDEPEPLPQ